MKPNFKRDLEAGKAGELAIQKLWPELELLHGKGADAKLPDGTLVELKCDRYDMDKTANFFFEIYGDIDTCRPGGPKKALADGCKYFVYYYNSHNVAYVFDTSNLMRQIDAYVINHSPKLIEVRNQRWVSVGYKAPRSFFDPLFVLSATDNLARLSLGQAK